MMQSKSNIYKILGIYTPQGGTENSPLGKSAYVFDCTFFRLICLTVKTLRRIAMRGFLVDARLPRPCSRSLPESLQATGPKKRTLKHVQLRFPG